MLHSVPTSNIAERDTVKYNILLIGAFLVSRYPASDYFASQLTRVKTSRWLCVFDGAFLKKALVALPTDMTYNATTISKKSLGKKPAKTLDTASIDGTDGTPPVDDLANHTTQARQIRRQPTRSRRGGPGVGNSDVDIGILDDADSSGSELRRFSRQVTNCCRHIG